VGVGGALGQGNGFLHVHVHAPYLLHEEFARAGGAFVPRGNAGNLALAVHLVHDEGFAAGGNHCVVLFCATLGKGVGEFGGFGFDDGGEAGDLAEFPASHGDELAAQLVLVQNLGKGALGVTLMVPDNHVLDVGAMPVAFDFY